MPSWPTPRSTATWCACEYIKHFGYYCTESSEHNAEYNMFYIKSKYPELIDRFNIPLDEYPRRCVNQINGWKKEYARSFWKHGVKDARALQGIRFPHHGGHRHRAALGDWRQRAQHAAA